MRRGCPASSSERLDAPVGPFGAVGILSPAQEPLAEAGRVGQGPVTAEGRDASGLKANVRPASGGARARPVLAH